MTELQTARRESAVFDGKRGFITLRDLFRWASRYSSAKPQTEVTVPSNGKGKGEAYYDWDQHMAEEGYLVLASRYHLHRTLKIMFW